MAVNMFEGARRVMKLTMVLIGIIGIVIAYNSEPDINLVYEISYFGENPVRINTDSCNSSDDATEYSNHTTAKGNDYDLTLCFKATASNDGKMMIPYMIDEETQGILGNDQYDVGVIKYTQSIKSNFSVPSEGEQIVDKQYWPKKIKTILEILGKTALSIFGFWIFCWVIGWIIRGFVNIPMGQDVKK